MTNEELKNELGIKKLILGKKHLHALTLPGSWWFMAFIYYHRKFLHLWETGPVGRVVFCLFFCTFIAGFVEIVIEGYILKANRDWISQIDSRGDWIASIVCSIVGIVTFLIWPILGQLYWPGLIVAAMLVSVEFIRTKYRIN